MTESNPTVPEPTADDTKQSVRPKRKLWKKILVVTGLLLILGLGCIAFRSWQAGSQFEARMATLRDQGVPITLDELYSKSLPEDDNAQTWLRRARHHTEQLDQQLRDYQSTEEYSTFRPNAEQMETLQEAFELHADVFSHYARAAECSGYQSDWRFGAQPAKSLSLHLNNVAESRSVMRHCSARAGLLMAEGKFDEALKLGLQMLALSRRVEYQPMFIGYLSGTACRLMSLKVIGAVLERSPLTDEQRQRIDLALADCESVNGFRHALVSERIYGLASFRSDIFGGNMQSIQAWCFKRYACDYLDLMDESIQLVTRPRHTIADELNGLTEREVGPLAALMVPGLLGARDAHDGTLARVRCVRLLNALQRHLPESISDDMVLSQLPGAEESRQDPFTGKPLIVRVADEAVVVYSVGINGTDDGGSLDDQEDQGIRIELKEARPLRE